MFDDSYFTLVFDDVASGAVADTYITMAALIIPDTVGARCRLLGFAIGPTDDAPQDLNLLVKLARIDDVSAGGAGTPGASITAANMARSDSLMRDGLVTGATGYTAEPTAYFANAYDQHSFNLRGGIIQKLDAPLVGNRDQLLGLLVAPLTAAAKKVSGALYYQVF